ncbi:DUF1800 domain-containing protein [Mucilaginibacter sp.]|uniref:DUF1800 domain-containing protein n=1 Tax=Mucilaginibacter sp. TaxID=1882438 RepID=UPI000CB5734A|nr:DUF1800 domain-containing protein [Mucilaginibacter sp.]PLW91642.1 MAG: DUF1800 domain-containing protein [Mucilaginibacter sp.]PMP65850.1 MAG: DUF1800 domain-containing protein [Mucilaginibacter sp.]HEK20107.1 DUF1800 domain-containing protein [Bacteroidota bacterium]
MNSLARIKHLYARAGFGLNVDKLAQYQRLSVKHAVDELFRSSDFSQPLSLLTANQTYQMADRADKTDTLTRKMFLQEQRQQEKDLNLAWLNQMSSTEAVLREKMVLFWHNHFACRTQNPWYAQQLNNIQRDNALGNFKTLLLQVSQSPAMLQFLNNQQNRKGHPNENFARELMELFTIGRGNYTEQDIKESARAFTGWGFNNKGEFVMRAGQHDDGSKTFMGQSGNFKGEDIIDILLQKKQTAVFICTKLYRYLVNDTPDKAHVNAMADLLYNGNYELSPVLKYVFTADWFYAPANVGNLIKSPIDLIIGLNRQFYITYNNPEVMMQFERALGQVLFYPPNVAGWPGGKNWIDSSSLMYRLKIPSTVLNNGIIDFHGKADPEDEALLAGMPNRKQVKTQAQSTADWDKFLAGIPKGTTKEQVAEVLLSPEINSNLKSVIVQSGSIKSMVVELVSTPEYQLC